MKTESRKTARGALAALLLCAVFGAARAEQPYERTSTAGASAPSASDEESEEHAAVRAVAVRRQEMIDQCEQSHGSEIDCEREVDTELRAEGLLLGARVIHLRPPR